MKFKNRYVLGTGYPWINITDSTVGLTHDKRTQLKLLNCPRELSDCDIPKYRLILEKIREEHERHH